LLRFDNKHLWINSEKQIWEITIFWEQQDSDFQRVEIA